MIRFHKNGQVYNLWPNQRRFLILINSNFSWFHDWNLIDALSHKACQNWPGPMRLFVRLGRASEWASQIAQASVSASRPGTLSSGKRIEIKKTFVIVSLHLSHLFLQNGQLLSDAIWKLKRLAYLAKRKPDFDHHRPPSAMATVRAHQATFLWPANVRPGAELERTWERTWESRTWERAWEGTWESRTGWISLLRQRGVCRTEEWSSIEFYWTLRL